MSADFVSGGIPVPSTGVVYWEGSQVVSATRGATRLGGEGYVELTGYAPSNGAAN